MEVRFDHLLNIHHVNRHKPKRMALDFADESVLHRFDNLAAMGIIRHAPSRIVPLEDQNFVVCFDANARLKNADFDTCDSLNFASAQPGPRSR